MLAMRIIYKKIASISFIQSMEILLAMRYNKTIEKEQQTDKIQEDMNMTQCIEITRHNVTPAQFLAYVRSQLKKKNLRDVASDLDLDYFARGNDLNFYYYNEPDRPCKSEKSVSNPYEMQTYILNWDGTCYNEICEMQFDNEKTGTGYYYLFNSIGEN